MIKTHSDDPDVAAAAHEALILIEKTFEKLPKANTFDYGGHRLELNEYGLCTRCTTAIAEAQAAASTLRTEIDLIDDETIKEHLELAAKLFSLEAEAAVVRAEFHNGQGTEPILNKLLAFMYERNIGDAYDHTHQGGQA